MKKQLIILAALLPLLGGCVYDFEANLTGDQYTVVIEGDIMVGGTTTVNFTRLNPEVLEGNKNNNQTKAIYEPGWGIPVSFYAKVEGEDGSIVEGEPSWGSCKLDTRSLRPDVRYRLHVYDQIQGDHYVSSWESVQGGPVIDSLSYKVSGDHLDVRVTFHSDGSTPYYCLAQDEEWEYHANTTTRFRYIPSGGAEPEGGIQLFPTWESHYGDSYGRIFDTPELYPNYTCWDSTIKGVTTIITTGAMASNKMVDFVYRTLDKHDRRISVKYRSMVSLRMVSKESFAYWESLEQASTQTGDLFSPIPSILHGNIINQEKPSAQVIGYIGVSELVTRDIFIKNEDIHLYRQPADLYDNLMKAAIGSGDQRGVKIFEMAQRYAQGYRPWTTEVSDDNLFYVWILEDCMDCRMLGGSTQKPKDWPDE
jgi:hypothetical protein